MTLVATAVTSNAAVRNSAGVGLNDTTTAAYSGYYRDGRNTADDHDTLCNDSFPGVDKPAAIVVEAVQREGGIYVADFEWLRQVERIWRDHGPLPIVDEIQAHLGRTGPFFSFEPAGITLDILTVSKSLSGMSLSLAITMMRPRLDVWAPGVHTGTFRGNNQAFVTAVAALENTGATTRWSRTPFARAKTGANVSPRSWTCIPASTPRDADIVFFIGLDCAR